jgi:hypothetical protein
VAARFVAQIKSMVTDKDVIPVWTTECEPHDMAVGKPLAAEWSSGFCGSVDCLDNCRARFAEQWNALFAAHEGPFALLALHKEFRRGGTQYGATASWIKQVAAYISQKLLTSAQGRNLWMVVQGFDIPADEEQAARQVAAEAGAEAVLVARIRIDQSYEPRIVRTSPETDH